MKKLVTKQKYFNPETGKMVGYVRAKTLGLIPGSKPAYKLDYEYSQEIAQDQDVDVQTIKISDLNFDSKLFVPISTGNKNLNQFISTEGGFMPATNVILVGTPGIGKSTVGLDMIVRAQKQGKKVLFISGEMNRIDMYRYCRRFPSFGQLDILFVSDYIKTNPVKAIEKVLENGYDLVLMDSWAEVQRTVRDFSGMGSSKAESWILDLMEKHNSGENQSKLYTCFLIIQQVTKSGEFVGSNRLKHMTSAMLEMYRDRVENRNVMEFSKNRVGTAGVGVSFTINTDQVSYASI
jgi:predicted ATP-dependent serine protease